MKFRGIFGGTKKNSSTQRFREARDRGCQYLLKICRTDGGFGAAESGVTEYHKALTAFQVCGRSKEAGSLCEWIRNKGMTADGDFGPRPANFEDFRYTYPNAWIIIGAHRLGEFGLSFRGMDFLMGFRDPDSGGFYSSSVSRDAETEQDVIYVSFCGLAAIYTGKIEIARAAGNWMRLILEAQPSFPKKLYTVYSRAKGLHILPDSELRYVVVSYDTKNYQFFFQLGAASAFLAGLYQATGEQEWLEVAKQYMLFAEEANDHLFRILSAGKVGWAASLLYTITGEEKYKQMAIRVGDNLIASQTGKGFWNSPGTNIPGNSVTAEMIIWLDAIHQAVGKE